MVYPELGWTGPVFLWIGPEAEVPMCPPATGGNVYEGYSGFQKVGESCQTCTCEPSACLLPQGLRASMIPDCPNDGEGAMLKDFLAPDGWTGECTAPPPISDAEAESLLFELPTRSACTPISHSEPKEGTYSWNAVVRACRPVAPFPECDERGKVCTPRVEGFRKCLYKSGEQKTCPDGYPEREIVHRGVTGEGKPTCSECECAAPAGGECTVDVSVYADEMCSSIMASMQVFQDPRFDACFPGLPPGDLRGLTATWIANEPAPCAPVGGKIVSGLVPAEAATFCCNSKP